MIRLGKTGRGGPDFSVTRLATKEYLELQFFKNCYSRVEAGEPILSSRATFKKDSPVSSLLLGSTEHSARGSEHVSITSQPECLAGLTGCEAQNPRIAGTADPICGSRLHDVNLDLRDALYSSISAEPVTSNIAS